jgi:hypothetical protein
MRGDNEMNDRDAFLDEDTSIPKGRVTLSSSVVMQQGVK